MGKIIYDVLVRKSSQGPKRYQQDTQLLEI